MPPQYGDRRIDEGTGRATDEGTRYGTDQDRGPASTTVPGADGPGADLNPDDFGPETVGPHDETNPDTGMEYGEISGDAGGTRVG